MEKNLDIYHEIQQAMELPSVEVDTYSPVVLAYIGDAIYEVVIRTIVVSNGNAKVSSLHKQSAKLVKASAQAEMMKELRPELTEEELLIYKRGRNAKPYSVAKNASVKDYRVATGFEALMGYLYLSGQTERMLELIDLGIHKKEKVVPRSED